MERARGKGRSERGGKDRSASRGAERRRRARRRMQQTEEAEQVVLAWSIMLEQAMPLHPPLGASDMAKPGYRGTEAGRPPRRQNDEQTPSTARTEAARALACHAAKEAVPVWRSVQDTMLPVPAPWAVEEARAWACPAAEKAMQVWKSVQDTMLPVPAPRAVE